MTEPKYLVTKDELNWIKNDCRYPHSVSCEGCEYTSDGDNPCTWKGANILMDEIIETRLYNPQEQMEKVLDELEDWAMPEFNELDGDGRLHKGVCISASGRLLQKLNKMRKLRGEP